MEQRNINEAVLRAAREMWARAATMRSKRLRYKKFTYGDQWSDLTTVDGMTMTTAEAARRHGRQPMTNNLIRRMVKSVIGRYRYMREEKAAKSGIDAAMREVYMANNLDELDCRALEEFLISGCAIQRVSDGVRHGRPGRWVENVNPAAFFVNRVKDPRGWDTQIVGMLHDWSLTETVMRLSRGNRRRAAAIRDIYTNISGNMTGQFSSTAERGLCRVIEIWTLECRERLRCHDRETATFYVAPMSSETEIDTDNACRRREGRPETDTRWETVTRWHCRWMAPTGELLDEYDSPYRHGSHPFEFKLYPLIDGEVHSLVEDVIDQQVYVNRLITLIDHVIGTSAKGVLLFPADQKIDGMKWEEVGRLWGSPDGILPYHPRGGQPQPQQVTATGGDFGARAMLDTQMKMFEEVSGVSETLMGGRDASMGAEHYESRVRDAVIAIADLLHTFENFIAERDRKIVAL